MKALILQYSEKSSNEDFDFSKIKYDSKLNLTIDVNTGLPAIEYLNLSTETHTRINSETSDSDYDNMNLMMGTLTKTSYQIEGSDDDASFSTVKSMMGTKTITLVNQETSDND
jgi:hypothetical protein